MELQTDIDAALNYIRKTKPSTPILPMVQNAVNGRWDGPDLARCSPTPPRAGAHRADRGVSRRQPLPGRDDRLRECAGQRPGEPQGLPHELNALDPHGWGIVLSVPFDDASWEYRGYADVRLRAADGLRPALGGKESGSIAAQDWFENTLDKRMKVLDPHQVIVAIGSYGYDWSHGQNARGADLPGRDGPASDAQADIAFDPDTQNPNFSYGEDGNTTTSGSSTASPPTTRSTPPTTTSPTATRCGGWARKTRRYGRCWVALTTRLPRRAAHDRPGRGHRHRGPGRSAGNRREPRPGPAASRWTRRRQHRRRNL